MHVRSLVGFLRRLWPMVAASRTALMGRLLRFGSATRALIRSWTGRAQIRRLLCSARGLAPDPLSLALHCTALSLGLALAAPGFSSSAQTPRAPAANVPPAATVPVQLSPSTPHNWFELSAATDLLDRAESEDAAPAAAPEPAAARHPAAFVPPPRGTGGEGVAAIYAAFGDSPGLTWALRVAYCESRYDPRAYNAESGASGLFQFMPATWNGHFRGWNLWDAGAQARAARIFYDNGWTNAWVCK